MVLGAQRRQVESSEKWQTLEELQSKVEAETFNQEKVVASMYALLLVLCSMSRRYAYDDNCNSVLQFSVVIDPSKSQLSNCSHV